jgi:predicted nucleic acid-binding protein
MIADVVLDTNVLVYAVSRAADDVAKRNIALELIETRSVGLSGQILQEFFVVVTKKTRRVLSADDALDWIESFEDFPIVPIDASLVRRGAELSARYQISYWDGAVVAAAQALQAATLYTEDLNHGQLYGDVRVVNPFRPS